MWSAPGDRAGRRPPRRPCGPVRRPAEPIVTPELLAAARAQLAKNREQAAGRTSTAPWLLRGLLRCGRCGGHYTSAPASGRRYYRCTRRDPLTYRRVCTGGGWLRADETETEIWTAIARVLRDPRRVLRAMQRRADRIGVREVEIQSEATHLTRQLAEAERRQRDALDLYLDQAIPRASLTATLTELAAKVAGLRERLQRAQSQATAQRAQEGQQAAIERWCVTARAGLDKLTATERHRLLTLLIDEVHREGPRPRDPRHPAGRARTR